jgi:hypothetical protein
MADRQTSPEKTPSTFHRFDPIDHSLFRLFTAFNAYFALVQFRGAVFTTEVPAAPGACHEGHPDSIFGFASITLASTAGFGHRYVSTTGCMSSWDVIDGLLQDVAHGRHTVRCTLIAHRCLPLQFQTDLRESSESQFLFDGDVSPFRNLNSLTGILEDLRDHLVFYEMLQLLARRVVG